MSRIFVPMRTIAGGVHVQHREIARMLLRLLAMLLFSVAMSNAHAYSVISFTATLTGATAPGTISLSVQSLAEEIVISKVEFFVDGTVLLATVSQEPFAYSWSNVPAGEYTFSARITDNQGSVTTKKASVVTVAAGGAQLYYVYSDQVNTAREITDAAGVLVWRADTSEPFGANVPNENPSGLGAFVYNPRFPGQYFDKETGLHYNYYRDYDPQTGRYIESDPIGLRGASILMRMSKEIRFHLWIRWETREKVEKLVNGGSLQIGIFSVGFINASRTLATQMQIEQT